MLEYNLIQERKNCQNLELGVWWEGRKWNCGGRSAETLPFAGSGTLQQCLFMALGSDEGLEKTGQQPTEWEAEGVRGSISQGHPGLGQGSLKQPQEEIEQWQEAQ